MTKKEIQIMCEHLNKMKMNEKMVVARYLRQCGFKVNIDVESTGIWLNKDVYAYTTNYEGKWYKTQTENYVKANSIGQAMDLLFAVGDTSRIACIVTEDDVLGTELPFMIRRNVSMTDKKINLFYVKNQEIPEWWYITDRDKEKIIYGKL